MISFKQVLIVIIFAIITSVLIIIESGCDLNEVIIEDSNTNKSRVNDCDGLKLDIIVQQDSSGVQFYHGAVENEAIRFSINNIGLLDFSRELSITLLVTGKAKSIKCRFTLNSIYKAEKIKLNTLSKFDNCYELDMSKFKKIN